MKVLPDLNPAELEFPTSNMLTLPQGLIGFDDFTQAEILYAPEHLPFLWLKLTNPKAKETLHFIVIEPAGFIPGYEPELFDEDAAGLDITSPAEVMILNIVTINSPQQEETSVNLVGPIVVNRRTRIGRQLVVSNYQRYSSRHPLVDVSLQENRATA
jgi:flagellar assembly factor FliW